MGSAQSREERAGEPTETRAERSPDDPDVSMMLAVLGHTSNNDKVTLMQRLCVHSGSTCVINPHEEPFVCFNRDVDGLIVRLIIACLLLSHTHTHPQKKKQRDGAAVPGGCHLHTQG